MMVMELTNVCVQTPEGPKRLPAKRVVLHEVPGNPEKGTNKERWVELHGIDQETVGLLWEWESRQKSLPVEITAQVSGGGSVTLVGWAKSCDNLAGPSHIRIEVNQASFS